MIHFNNTTGKNKGKVQITKLARFLNKSETTIRSLRKTNPEKFEREHLGAICMANGIDSKILETLIESRLTED